MGDRYTLTVRCDCGFEDDDVWYAPTCGVMTWKCPKCKKVIDLENYTGIDAVSCANTEFGEKAVMNLKRSLKKASVNKEEKE